MLESMGLPLPAESLLIATSIYCASTSDLNIFYVALSAVIGAVMGDNFGYLIGNKVGYPFLQKHGSKIRLTHERLILGQYLFRNHGGKVVFFGRFVAILRFFTALLAGANRMPWGDFLFHNAMGGICWAGGYSFAAYYLGQQLLKLEGKFGVVLAVLGVIVILFAFFFLRRNEKQLIERAEKEAKEQGYD